MTADDWAASINNGQRDYVVSAPAAVDAAKMAVDTWKADATISGRQRRLGVFALHLRHAGSDDAAALIKLGDDLALDVHSHEVIKAGVRYALPRKEFELLLFLVRSPRRVFSHAQILREVWGSEMDWQRVAIVVEHVRRIRKKIEDRPSRPRYLVTVRGAGYRFDP